MHRIHIKIYPLLALLASLAFFHALTMILSTLGLLRYKRVTH